MNYKLKTTDQKDEREKGVLMTAWRRIVPLMRDERQTVIIALVAILVSSGASLLAPVIIARAIDTYIARGNFNGVLILSALLLAIYLCGLVASYVQVRGMGGVGRRILFNLRNQIFVKLQELPIAFFNQNKAGDLISRINGDTDKLNQFFAQALMQFLGNIVLICGAGIFLVVINLRLGLAGLAPALLALVATELLSPWIKRASLQSLRTLGSLSGEISESLENFKVIAVFNRGDYFREKFAEANARNYRASITAGIANNTLTPIYTLATTVAQLIVVSYGIYLIAHGHFTIGLLVGFLLYVNSFYTPLRQLAASWSQLQLALAGLDRISEVLGMQNDMRVANDAHAPAKNISSNAILAFDNVTFQYTDGPTVLKDISLTLQKGKTYALVGPTGGGKTTTASLMARLYDPTQGAVYLDGKDVRAYDDLARTQKIGFILQEPFLFEGSLKENIFFANERHSTIGDEEASKLLRQSGLEPLLGRFSEGLQTKISSNDESLSLGQRQLVAFMRAILRNPEILILDEATANIDTVTEELLDQALKALPQSTTRVIIAHRLNTIANADEIFFVNGGKITAAGSMQNALDLLLHGERTS